MRGGGQRDEPAGPDHLAADQVSEPPLDPMGDLGEILVRHVLVGVGIVEDPVLDGLRVAQAVPGHDPVLEGGLDGGGGLGIEGIREVAAGVPGVGLAGVLAGSGAQLGQQESDQSRSRTEFVVDANVDL